MIFSPYVVFISPDLTGFLPVDVGVVRATAQIIERNIEIIRKLDKHIISGFSCA
jgi:hypothetical protein